MKYHYYEAFGLKIKSDFELPGLTDILPVDNAISIVSGEIPNEIKDPVSKGILYSASSTEFLLKVPNVGNYFISYGNQITIEANPIATPEEISLFLFGSAMGALLHQRGMIPLHASALSYNNKAILFMGRAGVGKSTLAAAFLKNGYKIIADDICPVTIQEEHIPYLEPGIPQIKLWADSLKKLDYKTEQLIRLRESLDKFRKPLTKIEFDYTRKQISHIFLLSTHNTSEFDSREIKGIEKFQAIKNNTYRFQFIKKTDWEFEFFKNFIPCLNTISVFKVKRPTKPFNVEELAQLILKTLQS